jgi:TatD DNase family protein
VQRGRLGVTIQSLDQSLADSFGLSSPIGALVSGVEPGGPAAKAGLEAGDVILAVNGQPVDTSNALPPLVADLAPGETPALEWLLRELAHPHVVAIGETGLDYYGMEDRKGGRSVADLEWQRDRFRTHIRAARACAKPLIIHTRSASDDTLAILREEGEDGAGNIAGGVFHCFTESMQVARAALDLGYYLSFSGIITFKNAQDLRDVVAFTPLNRILIETDSPYLAPVPYRGKTNNPSFVPYVAQQVAQCKGIAVEEVGHATSRNFETLFKGVMP